MNIIKYLFYVLISCILIEAWCVLKDPKGNFRVHNRVRLNTLTSSFSSQSNGAIRVAVQHGNRPVDIRWDSFDITDGFVIFSGQNGTLSVGKDNVCVLDVTDFGCFTGKLNNANALFQLRSQDKTDESQSFPIDPYAPRFSHLIDKNFVTSRGFSLDEFRKNFRLSLYSVESNGWRYIEIPYSISYNFQGEIGKLKLERNVYEY